MKKGTEPKD